jgi:hypothetical protein
MTVEDARAAMGAQLFQASGGSHPRYVFKAVGDFSCFPEFSARGLYEIHCDLGAPVSWQFQAKSRAALLRHEVQDAPETVVESYVSKGRSDFAFSYSYNASVTMKPAHPDAVPVRPPVGVEWFTSKWPEGWNLANGGVGACDKEAVILGPAAEGSPEIRICFDSKTGHNYTRTRDRFKECYDARWASELIGGFTALRHGGDSTYLLTNAGIYWLSSFHEKDPATYDGFVAAFRSKLPEDGTPNVSFQKEIVEWTNPDPPEFMTLRVKQLPPQSRKFCLEGIYSGKEGTMNYLFLSKKSRPGDGKKRWGFQGSDDRKLTYYDRCEANISLPDDIQPADDWMATLSFVSHAGRRIKKDYGPFTVK